MKRIKIGEKWVGKNEAVFIVAEAGVNHNGDINLAKRLIDIAKEVGADAVKFQSYKADRIITKSAPSAEYHLRERLNNKESWYDFLKRVELSEAEQKVLYEYCLNKRIIFLSTAYDEESADFLMKLGVPAFKIASTDTNNIPLLKHIARFNKPIILSTGMSTLDEIKESVASIKEEGNENIILLQCTANYPPRIEDVNLRVIDRLKREFNIPVGYSDHLAYPQVAIAAVSMGAYLYEAHFTNDRNLPGPDQHSSLDPPQLKQIINDIRLTERLLGSSTKDVTASERETRMKLRKSIVAVDDIKAGEVITGEKIGIKRPGTGLAPKYIFNLLGKKSKRNISKDEIIRLQDIG